MKPTLVLSLFVGAFALPAWSADSVEEVKSAAQKLASQPNYSWTAKIETPPREGDRAEGQGNREGRGRGGRGGGFGGTPSGKTEKDGFTVFVFTRGSNTTEAIVKGDKVALKDGDEWKTAEEMAEGDGSGEEGGFNRGQFMARRAQTAKVASADALELLGRVKSLKKEGDAYTGELTPEGIKQMFTFPRRGNRGQGQNQAQAEGGERERRGPDTSDVKGTAKFWVKDGVLAKYESHVTGKMPGFPGRDGAPGRETDVTRTTTVEIKDVGTTKVQVAPEARKKLK